MNYFGPFFGWNYETNCKISIVLRERCVNLPNKSVSFIFQRKFHIETRCFLEKFTQLEKFLHDSWSWRSWQISSLVKYVSRTKSAIWEKKDKINGYRWDLSRWLYLKQPHIHFYLDNWTLCEKIWSKLFAVGKYKRNWSCWVTSCY